MDKIFFDTWDSLLRTLIITPLAYFAMIVLLRVSGKRTLSKMNAFDFIVTIALGSSLATVALNKNVPLADGALVFFILIFLQLCITWLSARVKKIKRLVTSQPTLLLYQGELFEEVLKRERITLDEIHMQARKKGFSELKDIAAIVLETTGDIVIISHYGSTESTTMENVQKPVKD